MSCGPAQRDEQVRWTCESDERREPKRAAGPASPAKARESTRRNKRRYGLIFYAKSSVYGQAGGSLRWGSLPSPKVPAMPKLPDMSASAIKSREALTKIYKASKPKEAPAAPPKPRIAKGR